MRKQKVKHLRRLVARNWARIDDCCGIESFRQLCEECTVHRNVLYYALDCLAVKFCLNRESTVFAVQGYNQTDVGGVYFEMLSKLTNEIVLVELSPRIIRVGKDWQGELAESATQSDKAK